MSLSLDDITDLVINWLRVAANKEVTDPMVPSG